MTKDMLDIVILQVNASLSLSLKKMLSPYFIFLYLKSSYLAKSENHNKKTQVDKQKVINVKGFERRKKKLRNLSVLKWANLEDGRLLQFVSSTRFDSSSISHSHCSRRLTRHTALEQVQIIERVHVKKIEIFNFQPILMRQYFILTNICFIAWAERTLKRDFENPKPIVSVLDSNLGFTFW